MDAAPTTRTWGCAHTMSTDTVAVGTAMPAPRPAPVPASEPGAASAAEPASAQRKRPRSRMAALDGMRFLAAMFVLSFHYLGKSGSTWGKDLDKTFPTVHPVADYGYLGVEFFFLISGFVICMSSWGRGLGSFFASRVSRLYPAYWAAATIVTLMLVWKPAEGRPLPFSDYLSNLTMLHFAFGVSSVSGTYWTLWLELRFYLLFALVVWRGVTYRRVVAFCLLWTTASILTPSFNSQFLHGIVQEDYSPYFIAGIAMYLMHRYRPTPLLWMIVGTQWILAQHQIISRIAEGTRQTGDQLSWNVGTLLITGFFLAVLAVALGWLDWARWRWLTFLGSLTYPVYLLHENVGLEYIVLWHGHVSPWLIVLAATGTSLALATLIRTFVEKPLAPRLRKAVERSLAEASVKDLLREPAARTAAPQDAAAPVTAAAGAAAAATAIANEETEEAATTPPL